MKTFRGFLIPPSYRKVVKFVNGTPHLTALGAKTHRSHIIELGSHTDLSGRVIQWLETANVNGIQRAKATYLSLGAKGVFNYLSKITPQAIRAQKFLMHMVKDDQLDWKQDPTLAGQNYLFLLKRLKEAIDVLENPGLKKFESKHLLKYASDSSVRNWSTYIKQVKENYLPERSSYDKLALPDLGCVETALNWQYDMFDPNLSDDQLFARLISQGDFISRTRKTTSGGAPYFKNMGDFLDLDDDDNMDTWWDEYNHLALLWLMLPPYFKIRVRNSFVYVALERVQPGGILDFTGEETVKEELKRVPNKQRFIQAESAVFSHGMKPVHDVLLDRLRLDPYLSRDKISEEATTDAMKQIADIALTLGLRIQGADFSNFDASIEVSQLNDSYMNVVRMNMPKWVNSYVVDPYFTVAFTSFIFVDGLGLVITTGIKSGMVITNQGDTIHANYIDFYEIARYAKDTGTSLV